MKPFFIALFFTLTLVSCKSKQEKTQPTVEDISESVYASGIVKSKDQYNVFSKVNGILEDTLVSEGEPVKKGTPILIISNPSSKLNSENAKLAAELANSNTDKLNELKSTVDLARIKMKNDSLLFARQKKLYEQKIGTLNDLEQRELMYNNSLTNYNNAVLRYHDSKKQLLTNAQQSNNNALISSFNLDDFTIKSEIDGRLYKIYKEKGELVNTVNPIAVIGSDTDFLLELQVDEYDITKIKKGQKVVVSMNSYRNQAFEAKVEKINTIMDDRTRSFTIEASFVVKPPKLYPNLTVEANIILQTKEKALTIPRSYLIEDSYVLNKDHEKIKVVTGLKDYQKVEILSGLTKDDIIFKEEK